MKLALEAPVEFGDVRLAPTAELAALAELAGLQSQEERADALRRAASTLAAEDEARAEVARRRRLAAEGVLTLPRRH